MEEFIPKNIEDNGGVLGGYFKKRNAIEAGIAVGFIFFLFRFLLPFVPVLFRLIIGIALACVIGFFFLMGINNQPVSIAVLDYINFIKTRCVVSLAKPMPEKTPEVKRKRKIKIRIKKRKRRK